MRRLLVVLFIVVLSVPGFCGDDLMNRGRTVVYRNNCLERIYMPLGGMASGQMWLKGHGEITDWQVFYNNLSMQKIPNTFFAVRAKEEGGKAVVRVLQSSRMKGFSTVDSNDFTAEYPFARLRLRDKDLAVDVSMDVYNPLIPLSVKDSSIPCAVFEITAKNKGSLPAEVSFACALQNFVGQDGNNQIEGSNAACYGGNQNVFTRRPDGCELLLSVPSQKGCEVSSPFSYYYIGSGFKEISRLSTLQARLVEVSRAARADVIWVEADEPRNDFHTNQLAKLLSRVPKKGVNLILSMPKSRFFKDLIKKSERKKDQIFPSVLAESKLISEEGSAKGAAGEWVYRKRLEIPEEIYKKDKFKILKTTSSGAPLVIQGKFSKGTVTLSLAEDMPSAWTVEMMAMATGRTFTYGEGLSADAPGFGSVCVSTLSKDATAKASWEDASELISDLEDDGNLCGPEKSEVSPPGQTVNGALSVPFKLKPGEEKTITFIISWHFPVFEVFGHSGRAYSLWYNSAAEVSADVHRRFKELSGHTRLYHDSLYESNLPYYVLDSMSNYISILYSPVCFWAKEHVKTKKDYFGGYEGNDGFCPLNCTHVWGYAQGHAMLFPELGRHLREYDYLVYLQKNGEIQHRQHSPHGAFIDGQCMVILAAYREHLMSSDGSFLKKIWPGVKKAMEWLINEIDPDEDGVNSGIQLNTYDCGTSGAQTYLGSQYLAALGAAEKMALIEGDKEAALHYETIRKEGSKNQDKKLWNGEYYIQIPDRDRPGSDFNEGCFTDQLLGQWWSHVLNDGYLYPAAHVKKACESIMKYNFRTDFTGFKQKPYPKWVDFCEPAPPPHTGGVLNCSWPHGGMPENFIVYAQDVWNGVELSLAGLMMYEGQIENALRVIQINRIRYDGNIQNPFSCFYSRRLSSWSILLAAQGYIYDFPQKKIGFRPVWKPEDHVTFFTAAEGWGVFSQKRGENSQTEDIGIRWGKLSVSELIFEIPDGIKNIKALVSLDKRSIEAALKHIGKDVVLKLKEPIDVPAGHNLVVDLSW